MLPWIHFTVRSGRKLGPQGPLCHLLDGGCGLCGRRAVGSVAGVLWAKVPCVWPHAAVLLDERFPPSTQRCLDASSHVPGRLTATSLGAGRGVGAVALSCSICHFL